MVPAAGGATGLAERLLARGGRALHLDGDLRASRDWFGQAYRAAEQSGDPHAMARAALGLAGLWVHEQRAAPAASRLQAQLRDALSLAEPGSPDALRLRVRLAGENDYRNGEHAGILAALDEATRAGDPVARAAALSLAHHCVLGPDHGALRRWLADELITESVRTSGRSDLRRKAAGALARLRGHDLAGLPRSGTWLVTMNGVVEAAHLLGDAGTASRAHELLSPFGHLPMMASPGVACFGSVQHALGTACLTTGDAGKAAQHLRAAVDRNLALGHWPAAMMSRLRYAQALAQRSGPDDAIAARRELATARDEASALGNPLPGEVLPGRAMECSRDGRSWRVTLGSRSVMVEHSIGLFHLAVLIANPRREIPAIDLVAGVAALASDTASGIGDRTRRFTDDPEHARIAVGKAIRRAISRIAAADVIIGEDLRNRIRTGIRCSYWPA
jgi:hypothetical protein